MRLERKKNELIELIAPDRLGTPNCPYLPQLEFFVAQFWQIYATYYYDGNIFLLNLNLFVIL